MTDDECPVCGEPLDDDTPSLHWCSPECQEVWQADDVMPVVTEWFPTTTPDPRPVRDWAVAMTVVLAADLALLVAVGTSLLWLLT